MAKTTAQLQAHHHDLTQRQMLEQLITGPPEALCRTLEGDVLCKASQQR